jgi:hypothetical protein
MTTNTNTTTDTTTGSGQSKTYRYFISLQFLDNGNLAFTNLEMTLRKQLTSLHDIQAITHHFHNHGYPNALVLGFSQFPDAPAGGVTDE